MATITIEEVIRDSGVAFGTSGARGLVVQMTDEVCAAYVKAFLAVVSRSFRFERVALGMDLRPSSPGIARACVKAIRSSGFRADFCGTLPTPALAFYAQRAGVPAVMVTGSHIPFDRNGLKFYRPDGEISKADESEMRQLRIALPGSNISADLPSAQPLATQAYEQRYVDFFSPNMLEGMRLGLYEHSSVARDPLRRILEKLGARVASLARTDVFVPIDTEAVSAEDIERGRTWAAQYQLDAIISADGDGDRPLIGDETGSWLRGDSVGLLCARYLGVKSLAVPVSCNTAIERSGAFSQVIRTKIGSPYVIAGMQELARTESSVAGFEANGGFLLGVPVERHGKVLDALPTRDAVLPVLAVLAAAREKEATVSSLVRELPGRYTSSDRLQNFPPEMSRRLIESWARNATLVSDFFKGELGVPTQQDLTDGLRITFSDETIVHLRPSGNAPELRCYAEAETPERAEKITRVVLAKICNSVEERMS